MPLFLHGKVATWKIVIGEMFIWEVALGKLHIWEVAIWEFVTREVALGKMPLGKYLTPNERLFF